MILRAFERDITLLVAGGGVQLFIEYVGRLTITIVQRRCSLIGVEEACMG